MTCVRALPATDRRGGDTSGGGRRRGVPLRQWGLRNDLVVFGVCGHLRGHCGWRPTRRVGLRARAKTGEESADRRTWRDGVEDDVEAVMIEPRMTLGEQSDHSPWHRNAWAPSSKDAAALTRRVGSLSAAQDSTCTGECM